MALHGCVGTLNPWIEPCQFKCNATLASNSVMTCLQASRSIVVFSMLQALVTIAICDPGYYLVCSAGSCINLKLCCASLKLLTIVCVTLQICQGLHPWIS